MIDRENYEAYFLDYHEGRLSPEEVAQLLLFLEKNPELKEIFYEFENVELDKEQISFEDKTSLKKEVLNITPENFQEYLVGWLEGELTGEQSKAFENYLSLHPELNGEVELFRKTFLVPDNSVVLENKELLKKTPVDITETNFEEYFIASAEGLLNPEEEKRVQEFILRNPGYAKAYSLFGQLKLVPDQTIVFAEKDRLKQIPYAKKQASRVFYYYISAAAGVLLLLGLFLFRNESIENPPAFVLNDPSTSTIASPKVQSKDGIENKNPNEIINPVENQISAPENGIYKGIALAEPAYISPVTHLQVPAEGDLQLNRQVTQLQDEYYVIFPPEVGDFENEPVVAENTAASSEYLTVKQSLIKRVKSKIYKDNPEGNWDDKRFTLWDAAYAGAKGLNRMTGGDGLVRMDRNEKGGHTLTAGNFEISQR